MIVDYAVAQGAMVISNDDDFLRHIELRVMQRIFEQGTFDIEIDDLPFIGFVDRADQKTHISERSLKARIPILAKEASNPNRRQLWISIDEDSLSSGLTPKGVYHRFIRESIQGAEFHAPIFDKRILDYKMLEDLQKKYGYNTIPMTDKCSKEYAYWYKKLTGKSEWTSKPNVAA